MNIGGPYLVFENRSETTIYVKQYLEYAIPGRYIRTIEVDPGSSKEISSNEFEKRNHASGRASYIDLFVGQLKAQGRFTPGFFTDYVKIIFELPPPNLEEALSGRVVIKAVKVESGDLFKRFVKMKMLGDKYEGRPEQTLSTWHLIPH